ncbi:MAG: GNAT family N-acetyltransferase [Arenicella sp.]|jgi:RimJ/RimL family protein N-acetyltransferase|nr:GNAT family N-acetyltransferase [Arenicella sp.]
MIETERLLLRQWQDSDLVPFAQLNANAHVMRHFPSTLSRTASDALVHRLSIAIDDNGHGFYAVERKSDGVFIGFIGANKSGSDLPFAPCVDIGWRLDQQFWGCGFATEGAVAVRDDCFARCDLPEIVSMTPVRNSESENVMRKIGMRKDQSTFMYPGMAGDDPIAEHLLYRLNRAQWKAIS